MHNGEQLDEAIRSTEIRYDTIHLIFEFLLSGLVLTGSFAVLVVYHDPNVSSGVVAISTLVISYWFGKARPNSRS